MGCMEQLEIGVARCDLAYLRFILEGYDGLGILTALDARQGRAVITWPQSRGDEMRALVEALVAEGVIKEGLKS